MAAQSSPPKAPLKGILKKPASTPMPAPPSSNNKNGSNNQHPLQAKETNDATSLVLSPPVTNPAGFHAAETALQTLDSALLQDATFATIATLTAFPRDRHPPYSASNPSPSDAAAFKRLVAQLTEREYGEDLVEERNCEGWCGYALCARPRRTHAGAFRIQGGSFAPTDLLNRWCSDGCARRALNVGLQIGRNLVRGPDGEPVIELLGESREKGGAREEQQDEERESDEEYRKGETAERGKNPKNPAREVVNRLEDLLALERGDAPGFARNRPSGSTAGKKHTNLVIREKDIKNAPVAPDTNQPLHEQSDDYLVLEGYRTSFGAQVERQASDGDDA